MSVFLEDRFILWMLETLNARAAKFDDEHEAFVVELAHRLGWRKIVAPHNGPDFIKTPDDARDPFAFPKTTSYLVRLRSNDWPQIASVLQEAHGATTDEERRGAIMRLLNFAWRYRSEDNDRTP